MQRKHGLQSSLRYAAVATLHIEPVGEIKMLLNPDDEELIPAIIQGMRKFIRDNDGILMAVEFWPCALSEFGSDAGEFLKTLRSFGLHFFDLGTWQGRGGGVVFSRARRLRLKEKESAMLSEQYRVHNEMFTNLFLTRDRTPPGH